MMPDCKCAGRRVCRPAYGFQPLTGLLGAGNYILKVSGAVSGIAGGGYVAQIAAVPEPSEYLMMLAGLGIVGYAVRRKRAV